MPIICFLRNVSAPHVRPKQATGSPGDRIPSSPRARILLSVLLWSSGLRIQHCHCSGSGRCSGAGSVPSLHTSTCHSQKKKKNRILLSYPGKHPSSHIRRTSSVSGGTIFLMPLAWHALKLALSLCRCHQQSQLTPARRGDQLPLTG